MAVWAGHAYEASQEPRYLDAAWRATDWHVDHAPKAGYRATTMMIPIAKNSLTISCAACIATAVLRRLARWLPDRAERYRSVARETLKALLCNILTPGGVVLHGTWAA